MKRLEVSQERVLELFRYEDGKLFRRSDNKLMGCYTQKHRYARIGIDGQNYKVHRIIFLYHKGYMPKIIDHINGDRYDNRIENLREANTYQNRQNSRIYSTNRSGVKMFIGQITAKNGELLFLLMEKEKLLDIMLI
jgi:hypothetical protein